MIELLKNVVFIPAIKITIVSVNVLPFPQIDMKIGYLLSE